MTTRSDPYAIPYVKSSAPGHSWRRGTFTFILTLVAIVVFMASFAVGYARVNQGKVLPGVDVAGISVAGLDRNQAAAKLTQSLPSLSSGNLVVNINGVQESVPYSSFGRDYNLNAMLDQALNMGRAPNFVQQIQDQLRILFNGVSVQPQVTWSNDHLVAAVAKIAQQAQRDPVSASLSLVGGHYVVSPASDGQSVDVEGSVTDAVNAVNGTSAANSQISVHTSVVPPAVTTAQAQAAADSYERVVGSDLTVAGADLSTTITSDVLRGWVHLQQGPGNGNWQIVIEHDPIAQFVSNYALQTDVQPANATFTFDGGSGVNVKVVPSADGRATQIDTTTGNIMAALQARATGGSAPSGAELALASVAPKFSTNDATAISAKVTKIGEWTTHYTPTTLNGGGVNIQVPTAKINGYVVEPGALFDYLAVIGPITSPPYTAGAAIIHGHTVEAGVLGGGMCSSSTTLFNAAVRAGLDIRARRNHTYYITRYPVGLDATVWIAGPNSKQTMSFVNDTQYPILIRGINTQGAVTFELYGVPDGRTTTFADPIITNAQTAQDYYQYTDALGPGVQNRVEFVVNGFDSVVTRIVKDASGNIIHQDTFTSNYKTINGLVMVGRYPGDPPSGTTILASVWKANHPHP
ncbi:MAG TPA: VanW family protein [Candidatus Limnocylindrales bacterium]